MYEGALQDLIDELGRLPGIGPKSAQRIAFHVLSADPTDVKRLSVALQRVKELVRFCTTCFNVAELLLATDPNTEGEATATYLALLVKPMGITVTRLASGLPVGGDLEYADEITLGRAFEGRRAL